MYLLEPGRRMPPQTLSGFGMTELPPSVKLIGAMAAGAGILWLFSKTKPGRRVLSGARRYRRR